MNLIPKTREFKKCGSLRFKGKGGDETISLQNIDFSHLNAQMT
ncbi:MAG TPA: hypothetical protein PLS62_08420 [Desulfobacteraceae bacterium]|nr:hypothetical protein [Desulfobacteraceae bacterium]